MKTISNDYKTNIKEFGKQLDSIVSYTINGVNYELGSNELNSITPHYKANILKSIMKQLDIDSNVDVPIGTVINYRFGVKISDEDYDETDPTAYRVNYEYIDYGNYVVYSSEKQEDLDSYKLVCYDKMLYTMKDYESMNITYPITIRDYISAICNKIGLTFANSNSTFTNYNKEILEELYLTYNEEDQKWESLDYTFRDVLDELAQVTASTICINDNDELEIRYINDTNETITSEYLKDINVNFGEVYGPINTITFKRSADSDVISVSYPENLSDDLKKEISISDNQILNGNNRSDFLNDILERLLGLTYYINDYTSTGITYLDLCDRYNVSITKEDNEGNETTATYSCIMFNDEVLITQGLQENIYTDMPEESVTDYTKADKTDRRINQTYLIVDKQNQTIESVVSQTIDTDNPESTVNKVSRLTQRVGELESEISDIADLTISGESSYATIDLDNINESEPITIKIHPTSNNISYLYPRNNLYPSSETYLKTRTIRFENTTTSEIFDYILPNDLLYYDNNNYDSFELDYNQQTCIITKKCKYNADGTVSLLASESVETYDFPTINLTDGDYTISILGYADGYIFVRLMSKNIYTSQFYTKAETNSLINQTSQSIDLSVNTKLENYPTTTQMNSAISVKANEITSTVSSTYATKNELTTAQSQIKQTTDAISLEVSQKIGEDEVVSAINQSAEEVMITGNRFVVQANNFSLTADGNMTSESGVIGGWTIGETSLSCNITPPYDYTRNDTERIANIIRGTITPTQEDYNKYDFTKDGIINSHDLLICSKLIDYDLQHTNPGKLILDTSDWFRPIKILNSSNEILASFGVAGVLTKDDD